MERVGELLWPSTRVLASAAMMVGGVALARAEPVTPIRSETPIREVVLSDGVRRYTVPVQIGSAAILAGLDTGSTGLRVLPKVLEAHDARASDQTDSYGYGAGAKFDGVVGAASVTVGALRGDSTVQLVERVGCSDAKPRCAAGSIALGQYGVQGDGLPGEGFKAILGVNMATADVANPFMAIGARRWIIELPRPGDPRPGRLVLNPTDDEVSGFVELPIIPRFADRRGGAHDAVQGCLVNEASHQKFCGAVVLDTGDPGVRITQPDAAGSPWPEGAPATLRLADATGRVRISERIVIERRDHASHMSMQRREGAPMTLVAMGVTPYLAYSVLYDPGRGAVGFKPRAPLPGGPQPTASSDKAPAGETLVHTAPTVDPPSHAQPPLEHHDPR